MAWMDQARVPQHHTRRRMPNWVDQDCRDQAADDMARFCAWR
jgi:hypothetical protein